MSACIPECGGRVKTTILSVLIVRHNLRWHMLNKRSTEKFIVLIMVLLLFQKLNDGKAQEPKTYIEYYLVLDNGEVITSDKCISQNSLVHNLLCETEMSRSIWNSKI